MKKISEKEVVNSLKFHNPWWDTAEESSFFHHSKPRRIFFEHVLALAKSEVRRAVIVLGARRVGKTVLLLQMIEELIRVDRVEPKTILYVSLETPTYVGITPQRMVQLFCEHFGHKRNQKLYIFFDEIQYQDKWELHLKTLVDNYPNIKFVASGSAAAALKLKGKESGAGRFTDFLLPPMTFGEFLQFKYNVKSRMIGAFISQHSVHKINQEFIEYINAGGFPEAVMSKVIQKDFRQFVGSDILDKALLRDLPSLYGIDNPQQLHRLFAMLAFNTGQEISWTDLEKEAQIARNTLDKYLQYLEAALLIRIVYRVDNNVRKMKKAHTFKVYLTNPCMRAALFGPMTEENPAMGHLVETAVCAHMAHLETYRYLHYARWQSGEVDFVVLDSTQKPKEIIEIKWSDKAVKHSDTLKPLLNFASRNNMPKAIVSTKTVFAERSMQNVRIEFYPASFLCFLFSLNQEYQALERSVSLLKEDNILAKYVHALSEK